MIKSLMFNYFMSMMNYVVITSLMINFVYLHLKVVNAYLLYKTINLSPL